MATQEWTKGRDWGWQHGYSKGCREGFTDGYKVGFADGVKSVKPQQKPRRELNVVPLTRARDNKNNKN